MSSSTFDFSDPDVNLIAAIHRYKRPKGSRTEQAFIETFLTPLGVKADAWGNLHLDIGENPTVLWSSHTDTVHTSDGFQQVSIENGVLRLKKKDKANCLGADDGAGVWLMMEMIKAKVPGKYIFHYGEEKGCEGSENLAKHNPEVLKNITSAIAFDRKGFGDVITFMSTRVCSDAFADSLIKQLPPGYKTCQDGARTDVKLYERLVDECTNISVGYNMPHMPGETLNLPHLISIRDKLVKIDASKFVIKRNPSLVENKPAYTHTGGGYRHYGAVGDFTPTKTGTAGIAEIIDRHELLIADLLTRAGVTMDGLMHLIVEEQKRNPKVGYTYREPKLIPPNGWKSPYIVETTPEKPAETKTETKPDTKTETPATGATARVTVDTPADSNTTKDVAPRHVGQGAAEVVSRGGGTPLNNVHPLRTGNPIADGIPGPMAHHASGVKH